MMTDVCRGVGAMMALIVAFELFFSAAGFAEKPDCECQYVRRGVAPAEGFGALFGLGPEYGRRTGAFQSVQKRGGAPGFIFGGTNGLKTGSSSWADARRNIQYYGQAGDALQYYSQLRPGSTVPRANNIVDIYFGQAPEKNG